MKSGRHVLSTACVTLAMVFLIALPVLAAEGAEPNPADTNTGVVFRWLNFVLVFGTIGYLLAKNGGGFFRANAKEIASRIHEATAAKAEADRALSEVEAKISRIDQEVGEMRETARKNFAIESERLRVSGLAEIEKINAAAHAELAASERVAQYQLREVAASMAVERAGALLRSKMNDEVRTKLFQTFLGELGRSKN
jgi:F-type H+-transporting ATPase subunit b